MSCVFATARSESAVNDAKDLSATAPNMTRTAAARVACSSLKTCARTWMRLKRSQPLLMESLSTLYLRQCSGSFFGSVGAGPKSSQTGDVAAGSLAASSKQASLLVAHGWLRPCTAFLMRGRRLWSGPASTASKTA